MVKKKTALDGAYLKGLAAAVNDEPLNACPYKDKRKADGKLSWSRAFRNAWRDGWQEAKRNPEQALITIKYYKYARRP